MLKDISVLMLILGYCGTAINFFLYGNGHLGVAMALFGVAVWFLFY
jgi:hypothetical protein